jgi:hypothetical protein
VTRRLLILPGTIALVGAIALGACSGSTPAASNGAPAVVLPSVPAVVLPSVPAVVLPSVPAVVLPSEPAVVLPTIPAVVLPSFGTSQLCAGKPTFDPTASAQPSFETDSDLAAKFPQQIAGAAPSDITTLKFVDSMCLFGGVGLDQIAAAFAQAGADVTTASSGSANYSVNSETVSLSALRTPGGDATKMIAGLAQLATALGGQANQLQNLQQVSVGGKNVFSSKQTDGSTDYAYPAGDTVWFFSTSSDQTATTVLGALP